MISRMKIIPTALGFGFGLAVGIYYGDSGLGIGLGILSSFAWNLIFDS